MRTSGGCYRLPITWRRTYTLHVAQSAFPYRLQSRVEEDVMAESVYKIIEIVGTSTTSWEKAAAAAVERASTTLRDLRVAEVCEQDITISDGKVESYRVRLKVSFKFED
jgi:flavin-binding protein dodecin